MTGRLIIIEGADRTGKSTLAKALQAKIDGAELTWLPYEFDYRSFKIKEEDDYFTRRRYFTNDSEDHWYEVVKPLLDRGETVVQDRSLVSNAFYGYTELQKFTEQDARVAFLTDLTSQTQHLLSLYAGYDVHMFVLTASKEELDKRRGLDGGDPFENDATQETVISLYNNADEFFNVTLLDATQPTEELVEEILYNIP